MSRVLSDFLGAWSLEREIFHANGTRAVFAGRAEWTPRADGADYLEIGRLEMPGVAPMHAERQYMWRDDLSVWFPDGRFFHEVPDKGGAVHHACPPDSYQGIYRFEAWPRFETEWRVTGPRKSYTMVTQYARLDV